MLNMQELNRKKEQIISLIRTKGPSLPIQLSNSINTSPLITSAFLSELIKDQKLKISNMKVGNSPLYFLPDQEQMLENFTEYLNQKEQQAFHLLKDKKILKDGKQEPAIRVALMSIKDFAIPLKVRIKEEIILFWKYSQLTDHEAREIIQRITTGLEEPEKIEEKLELPEKISLAAEKLIQQETPQIQTQIQAPNLQVQKPKKKELEEYEFSKKIKEYLAEKDIEIIEIIIQKKKELAAKIRTDMSFGKQSYYLTAKEKKNITENDLALALQKAQAEKMPAFMLSTGDLNKKAQLYRREWYNLLKFEKLNF